MCVVEGDDRAGLHLYKCNVIWQGCMQSQKCWYIFQLIMQHIHSCDQIIPSPVLYAEIQSRINPPFPAPLTPKWRALRRSHGL